MKEYRNEDVIVYWYPELCSHSGHCWRTLPGVFKPQERPWINVEAAPAHEIVKTIDGCPSGALRYELPEGSRLDPDYCKGSGWAGYEKEHPAVVKIKVIPNGPLALEGPAEVYDASGQLLKAGAKLNLCRCGLSQNRPFCDGTHFREGWNVDAK